MRAQYMQTVCKVHITVNNNVCWETIVLMSEKQTKSESEHTHTYTKQSIYWHTRTYTCNPQRPLALKPEISASEAAATATNRQQKQLGKNSCSKAERKGTNVTTRSKSGSAAPPPIWYYSSNSNNNISHIRVMAQLYQQ